MLQAAKGTTSPEKKEEQLRELHRDFFISPQDKKDDDMNYGDINDEQKNQGNGVLSIILAETLKKKIIRKKNQRFNWENHLHPETANECLEDAKIRRDMIRKAAKFIIEKCAEIDIKKEAEIKSRNDDKEIEAWFNQPRYHDKRLLNQAKFLVEAEFIRPVRDEKKRRKIYGMYRQIFRDLTSFKREFKNLSHGRPLKTAEVAKHYIPNTVSMESYMYALDRKATIDQAVCDMVGKNSQMKQQILKEREEAKKREEEEDKRVSKYLRKVRDLVKETNILEEEVINPELLEQCRKRKLRYLFSKQLIQCVDQMKQMNLTPEMIMEGNVFAAQPFFRGELSHQFFDAVKEGKLIEVNKMLRKDRFLVYEFDDTK